MMKKRLILIALLVILVVGCDQFRTSKPSETKQGSFVGGTSGLNMLFAKDEPPLQVLDAGQQEFFITLILENKGEYNIPNGGIVASLSGLSREALGLSNLNVRSNFVLDGVGKALDKQLPGGVEELQFGKAMYKPDIPADFTSNLRADVCYDYETNAITTLCLRKSVLRLANTQEICDVANQNLVADNSGAPLQVQNMQARPVSQNKIRISFDVVNVGKGLVYSPGTFSNFCGGNDDKKDNIKVKVSMPGGGGKVSCSRLTGSEGMIKLVDNVKTVTCDIDTSSLQDVTFEDLLTINLKYMYRDAISAPITIKDAAF